MAEAAKKANVQIVTGDTKVVEKGKGDGIFINTTGVGVIRDNFVTRDALEDGDEIIINGTLGDHGVAVMSQRAGLDFECQIISDAASLDGLVDSIYENSCQVKNMRDPTRGGVGATLNEWANQHNIAIEIDEANLPVSREVQSACELLGLDPLYIANEGKVLIACEPSQTEKVLDCLRGHPLGENAQVIATVRKSEQPQVFMKTTFGGKRRVDWLSGEQLPRIC